MMSGRLRHRLLAVAAGASAALVVIEPAWADNCSGPRDCFSTGDAATKALLGLLLPILLSYILDTLPIIGPVKGAYQFVAGKDPVTGAPVTGWDRALGLVPVLGKGFKGLDMPDDLKKLLDHLTNAGEKAGEYLGTAGALDSAREAVAGSFPSPEVVAPPRQGSGTDAGPPSTTAPQEPGGSPESSPSGPSAPPASSSPPAAPPQAEDAAATPSPSQPSSPPAPSTWTGQPSGTSPAPPSSGSTSPPAGTTAGTSGDQGVPADAEAGDDVPDGEAPDEETTEEEEEEEEQDEDADEDAPAAPSR